MGTPKPALSVPIWIQLQMAASESERSISTILRKNKGR